MNMCGRPKLCVIVGPVFQPSPICPCINVKEGLFCFNMAKVSHGENPKMSYLHITSPPSSGMNELPKADPSCLPLPPSGDINHSLLRLHFMPRLS